MISQNNKSGLRNPWVLGMLALMTVVLSVNATFIWFATKEGRSTLVERDYKTWRSQIERGIGERTQGATQVVLADGDQKADVHCDGHADIL